MDPQVQQAIDDLKEQISVSRKSAVVVKDRKISVLDDRVDDPDEWFSCVESYVNSRFDKEEDKVSFILDHVQKKSRDELRFRLNISTATSTQIFDVLRPLHCKQPTLMLLQQRYYSRQQGRDEILDNFAHALMELAMRITDSDPNVIPDKDASVKSRFAEGVYDMELKRELKRLNTERPALKFHELRECARQWTEDSSTSRSRTYRQEETASLEAAALSSTVSDKLLQILEKQQKQLQDLEQSMQRMSTTRGRAYRRGPGRGQRTYRGGHGYRQGTDRNYSSDASSNHRVGNTASLQPESEIICRYCNEKNHMEKFCLKKRSDLKNGNLQGSSDEGSGQYTQPTGHEETFKKIAGRCPTITAEINGVKVPCLLDSGSQVSTVTESFFESFLKQPLEDVSSWFKVSAANGTEIPCVGLFETCIMLSGVSYENICFLVVKDPVCPISQKRKKMIPGVIGANVLNIVVGKFGTDANCSGESNPPQDEGLLEGLKLFQIRKATCERVEAHVVNSGVDSIGWVKVNCSKNKPIHIGADCGKVVPGTVPRFLDGIEILIESSDTLSLPPGVVIYPSVCKVDKGKVNIQLRNYSKNDVTWTQAHKIGRLSACEVVQHNMKIDCMSESEIIISYDQQQEAATSDINWVQKVTLNNNLKYHQREKVLQLLHKYSDVFSKHEGDLGCTDMVEHCIRTNSDKPVKQRDRRIPPPLIPEVRKILQDWLDQGIIRASDSPYASQLVLVRKKNKQLRICVDYRFLNLQTVKDAFPLPSIEEALDALGGAEFFCSLDMTQGYMQVPVKEEDRYKTAFRALGSLYEFSRLPFGVCNGPATFSRLMAKCFGDINYDGIVLFLDDLMAYGRDFCQTLYRLEVVFQRLREFNLKLNPSKCSLFQERISYLSHIVSKDGIHTDPEKIRAVVHFPIPCSETDVRSFVGLCSYYRRFIKNFSLIAAPLNSLLSGGNKKTKKASQKHTTGIKFKQRWTEEADNAFKKLKEVMTQAPILGHPRFDLPFQLEIDASLKGLGAVLSQIQDGRPVIIAFASRGLKPHERNMENYSSMKLELLGMTWAITKKFKDYLYASKFICFTDNNPLSHVMTTKKTATEMNWLADLANFDFEIKYKPGKKNAVADALSRHPVCCSMDLMTKQTTYCKSSEIPEELRLQLLEHAASTDKDTVKSPHQQLCISLPRYTKEDLARLQNMDKNIAMLMEWLKSDHRPTVRELKQSSPELRKFSRNWDRYCFLDGILYRKIFLSGEETHQFVVPLSLRKFILKHLHDLVGHQGSERTLSLMKFRCYWPTMTKDVESWVKKCERCLISKEPHIKLKSKMCHLFASRPLDTIAIDFTILEKSSSGFENVLVVTDIFSKFTQAYCTKDQKAPTVAKLLVKEWFLKLGVPRNIHSDRGGSFENELMYSLCRMYSIKKTRTSPYHASGNGQCERYNRTMHNLLKTLNETQKRKWHEHLPELVYAYNATPHTSTGYAPYFLFMGRQPTLPIDVVLGSTTDQDRSLDEWVTTHRRRLELAITQANQKIKLKAEQRKTRHDKKVNVDELRPGSKVLLRKRVRGRNKIQDFWDSTPYRVTEKIADSNAYRVQSLDGSGRIKTANRVDLLDCTLLLSESDREPSHSDQQSRTDSDSDSDLEMVIEFSSDSDLNSPSMQDVVRPSDSPRVNDSQNASQSVPNQSNSDHDEPVSELRRSKRTTAGQHSNKFNLPRSVLQNRAHEVEIPATFQEFAGTINELGANLGTILMQSFHGVNKLHET